MKQVLLSIAACSWLLAVVDGPAADVSPFFAGNPCGFLLRRGFAGQVSQGGMAFLASSFAWIASEDKSQGSAKMPRGLPRGASPSEKWEKDIQAFEKADRTNPPPQGAVLFIGSSTIRLWKTLRQDFPEYKVINRGFGGSQIADSIYYADRIVIPYKPKMIVFYAGGNDINAGKTPEKVCEDFKMFVERVRAKLPEVRIAYMSTGPSPARWAQVEKQKKVNELIREYIIGAGNMDYIDVFDVFLGPDGKPLENLFVKDKLHNSDEGYKIRVKAVRPYLEKRFPSK